MVAISHHEQPAVSLRLIVRAGSAQDPEDRPGVASLAATLLDQGTTTRSAEQIADAIDSIGGALGTGAGADLSFIQAVVMKDSLNVGLDLVSDLAQHPAFSSEEIERQRQQILSGLKVSYDDPDYLANMVFDRLVYGFHPYGKPQTGTPATIAGIRREDLLGFHKKWFGANNAILAIVGDVSADEAFAGAERAFGGWGRAGSEAPTAPAPPQATRRLVVIDRPGAVQTEIRVGNIGDSPQAQRLHGARPRHQGPRRRGSEPSPPCAPYRARAHLRCLGRHERHEGNRRHRRRDQHAIADNGRNPAIDGGRVLAPDSRSCQRPRAPGGAGVPDRILSVDDRDPEPDRAAGAQRGVLWVESQRAADLSGAGQCRDLGGCAAGGA